VSKWFRVGQEAIQYRGVTAVLDLMILSAMHRNLVFYQCDILYIVYSLNGKGKTNGFTKGEIKFSLWTQQYNHLG
jgi:hypothetical protein